MQAAEYDTLFQHEDVHWWFRGTRAVIRDVAARALASRPAGYAPRVLDVGCGTGGTLASLDPRWRRSGVEPDERAVDYCRQRGLDVRAGSALELPFDDATFDLVMALDVVEHIEDDHGALAEMVRVCRPNGALLLTVPAHPMLWSEHDVALQHVRRYRRREFRQLLARPDLRIEQFSYYNAALFPAVAAVRLGKRAFQRLSPGPDGPARSDVSMPPALINAALRGLLASERFWLRRAELPFGVSLIAVARRLGDNG